MPVIFTKAASDDPILETASRLAPELRKAFLRAVAALKDSVTMDALLDALKTGDVDRAMSVLAISDKFTEALKGVGQEARIASFRQAISDTFIAGGKVAAENLPRSIGVKLAFDLVNPESAKFLEKYSFSLIRQISSNTTEAVREVVSQAFKEGGHPYEQARKIKTFIGLTSHQARAVRNYRLSLLSANTLHQSLTRSLRDGRFDPTVRRAMRNNSGLTPAQVDKLTDRYQERFIQYRAQTIARTESIRASNRGQRALWNQAKSQGLLGENVRRRWITSGDDATCEICGELDGEEAELDEEFDDGIMEPPDPHSDCRCSVGLVFGKP